MPDIFDLHFPPPVEPSAEEEMVEERKETSAEQGNVSNNPSKDEKSREAVESKVKTPGVASAPTVRDTGSDRIPTQSGLRVSTTGHLTQALEEAMQDPLVLEARVLEAKAPIIPPLKGSRSKDLKKEVPLKDGGKPVENQDVVADQKIPQKGRKKSHREMEDEVEVDEVEPEPTKPHQQMQKVPNTHSRRVLKAKSAKAVAKVQNNAMQGQGQAAVVEQTPAIPANLQALGIDDTGPQWSRALIEMTRIAHNQRVEYEARFRQMEAQVNALEEINKDLTKLVSNGTARGVPERRPPQRPEPENFVRHPHVNYPTPEGAQIAETGKIPPETKAKEAGKQGNFKPAELSNPQREHPHSRRVNARKSEEEFLKTKSLVLKAAEMFRKNLPEKDVHELDELTRQLNSCDDVSQQVDTKRPHEKTSSSAMARRYKPPLDTPDIYEYTVWDKNTIVALKAENIQSTVDTFNPEVNPGQTFAHIWRQVLMYTSQLKLDDKLYRHILTIIMRGSSSRVLCQVLSEYDDLDDIIHALDEIYPEEREFVDERTFLKNFKRKANESIHACMQRATMLVVRMRHIYRPEEWTFKMEELLVSALRHVVSTETKQHIENEEQKYLKAGMRLTYRPMFDLVERIETKNAQSLKADRELRCEASSGSPMDISTASSDMEQIADRMAQVEINSGALTDAPRPVRRAMNRVKNVLQGLGVNIAETDILKQIGEHQRSHSPLKKRSSRSTDRKSPRDLGAIRRTKRSQHESHSEDDNRQDRGRERSRPPPQLFTTGNVRHPDVEPQGPQVTSGNPERQGRQGIYQQPWVLRRGGMQGGRGNRGHRGGRNYVNRQNMNFNNGNYNANYQKYVSRKLQQQRQRMDLQNYFQGESNRGNLYDVEQPHLQFGQVPGPQPVFRYPMYPPPLMVPAVPQPQAVPQNVPCRTCRSMHRVNSFCPFTGERMTLNYFDL